VDESATDDDFPVGRPVKGDAGLGIERAFCADVNIPVLDLYFEPDRASDFEEDGHTARQVERGAAVAFEEFFLEVPAPVVGFVNERPTVFERLVNAEQRRAVERCRLRRRQSFCPGIGKRGVREAGRAPVKAAAAGVVAVSGQEAVADVQIVEPVVADVVEGDVVQVHILRAEEPLKFGPADQVGGRNQFVVHAHLAGAHRCELRDLPGEGLVAAAHHQIAYAQRVGRGLAQDVFVVGRHVGRRRQPRFDLSLVGLFVLQEQFQVRRQGVFRRREDGVVGNHDDARLELYRHQHRRAGRQLAPVGFELQVSHLRRGCDDDARRVGVVNDVVNRPVAHHRPPGNQVVGDGHRLSLGVVGVERQGFGLPGAVKGEAGGFDLQTHRLGTVRLGFGFGQGIHLESDAAPIPVALRVRCREGHVQDAVIVGVGYKLDHRAGEGDGHAVGHIHALAHLDEAAGRVVERVADDGIGVGVERDRAQVERGRAVPLVLRKRGEVRDGRVVPGDEGLLRQLEDDHTLDEVGDAGAIRDAVVDHVGCGEGCARFVDQRRTVQVRDAVSGARFQRVGQRVPFGIHGQRRQVHADGLAGLDRDAAMFDQGAPVDLRGADVDADRAGDRIAAPVADPIDHAVAAGVAGIRFVDPAAAVQRGAPVLRRLPDFVGQLVAVGVVDAQDSQVGRSKAILRHAQINGKSRRGNVGLIVGDHDDGFLAQLGADAVRSADFDAQDDAFRRFGQRVIQGQNRDAGRRLIRGDGDGVGDGPVVRAHLRRSDQDVVDREVLGRDFCVMKGEFPRRWAFFGGVGAGGFDPHGFLVVQNRHRVGVGGDAAVLRVAQHGQLDDFVAFAQVVIYGCDGHRDGRHAYRQDGGSAHCYVVRAVDGRSVQGVIHVERLAGVPAAHDSERGGALVFFGALLVGDLHEDPLFVVGDGHRGGGAPADGVARAGGQGQDHRFVPFDERVVNRRDGHLGGLLPGGDGDGGACGHVVLSREGRPGEGEIHAQRHLRRSAAGDGERAGLGAILRDLAGGCGDGDDLLVVHQRDAGAVLRGDDVAGAGREGERDRLAHFRNCVVQRPQAERHGLGSGRQGDRAGEGDVVAAVEGGPADGVVDGQRLRDRAVAREAEGCGLAAGLVERVHQRREADHILVVHDHQRRADRRFGRIAGTVQHGENDAFVVFLFFIGKRDDGLRDDRYVGRE